MKRLMTGVVLALAMGMSSANAGTSINLWAGFTGADGKAMQGIVEKFTAANPDISVNYYTAPWSEMFTKFATAYGTSSGPDAVIMHVTDIANFASRGMLEPLDDLVKSLGVEESDFAPAIWAGNTYQGSLYGIALDYHPMGVFKNVKAFKEAGIDPNIEFTSKEQFLDIAHKLTKADGSQYGIAIGSEHSHTMRYWYGLLYQTGGTFLNPENTKATFDDAAGVEALKFLADLVNVEKVAPYQEGDIDRDFLAGTTAMVIEGPWFIPTMAESGMEYTVARFPQIFEKPATWANSHTLTIASKPVSQERREAAIKLVSYISKNSVQWGISSGQIPASYTVVKSDEYKAMPTYDKAVAFLNEATVVHYEPLVPSNAKLGADNPLSPVLVGILDAIRGGSSPEDALKTAADTTDEILKD